MRAGSLNIWIRRVDAATQPRPLEPANGLHHTLEVMSSELALGVIGVGNLGGALAEGALSAGAVARVAAFDVAEQRLQELVDRLGPAFVPAGVAEVARQADMLVFAVKPHILPMALAEARPALVAGCPVVSVAAGVQIARIEEALPPGWPVIRAMPNLAMLVGESATAICSNQYSSAKQVSQVESIFRAVGRAVRVEERQMHAVTGLTGSGPAYVSLIVEGLVAGAVKKGLQPALAQELTCQLLLGSAKLMLEKGLHPALLKDQVTTPAGTTIAGLWELESHAVRAALLAAVEAASERSEELAQR